MRSELRDYPSSDDLIEGRRWREETALRSRGSRFFPAVSLLRDMHLVNRVVVSTLAQYQRVDGVPGDGTWSKTVLRAHRLRGAHVTDDDLHLGGRRNTGLHRNWR